MSEEKVYKQIVKILRTRIVDLEKKNELAENKKGPNEMTEIIKVEIARRVKKWSSRKLS